MKYPGGLAFLGLVVAHAARRPAEPAWRRVVGRDTVAAAGLGAVGFVLGTPFALLTPVAFVRGVLDELREVHTVQFGNEADAPGYLFHLAYSLPEAMGWPLYLLALAGLVVGGRPARRPRGDPPRVRRAVSPRDRQWSSRFERYVIPLLPCLTLLAAVALVGGVAWLSKRLRLVAGAVARHRAGVRRGGPSRRAGARAGRRSTTGCSRGRTRASSAPSWVERHVPPGARIALEPYSLMLPVAREQLREAPGSVAHLQQLRPDARAVGAAGSLSDGYWLVRLDMYDLDRLLGDGVQYVVLSGFVYQRHRQACDRHPAPVPLLRGARGAIAARVHRLARRRGRRG